MEKMLEASNGARKVPVIVQDGKVTIAVMSFLRFKHPRTEVYPRGHISVWLEEQKLPPLGE